MPRSRAPKGWKRVTFTPCGVLVCTPQNGEVRKKEFRGTTIAYTLHGSIYVKYPGVWDDPRTRAHEMEHIKQWRILGSPLFEHIYTWCHNQVGYKNNPFEVAAKKAEEKAAKKSQR